MNYIDLYNKRVGIKNGDSLKDRINRGREANFEKFLKASPHHETFQYKENKIECVLEPYQQDNSKTLMHLLCRISDTLDPGAIIEVANEKFMVYYLDQRKNSGYNRWVLIKMNHYIEWTNRNGEKYSSDVYLHGQKDSTVEATIKSRSREATLYMENTKLEVMIMPINKNIELDSYLTISVAGLNRNYRVTGYDFVSTEGVIYVSLDPTIKRDLSEKPKKESNDEAKDFFWLGEVDVE